LSLRTETRKGKANAVKFPSGTNQTTAAICQIMQENYAKKLHFFARKKYTDQKIRDRCYQKICFPHCFAEPFHFAYHLAHDI
jgi:hypothetical protein